MHALRFFNWISSPIESNVFDLLTSQTLRAIRQISGGVQAAHHSGPGIDAGIRKVCSIYPVFISSDYKRHPSLPTGIVARYWNELYEI
jgi:hypothetical protein